MILTTYNMVTSSSEDRALFKKMRYSTVVYDEAHMLKNMQSQRYDQLMKLKVTTRLTPAEGFYHGLGHILDLVSGFTY